MAYGQKAPSCDPLILWSLGLDRPLAYFLVLLHNVFAEMYYIFRCFAVGLYCIYVEEIKNYVKLCYVIGVSPRSWPLQNRVQTY